MTMLRGAMVSLMMVMAMSVVAGQIVMGEKGERPPVVFDHDLHTTALAEDGKHDCLTCHPRNTDPVVAREDAHRRCGDCHLTMEQGPHPALCAACHDAHASEPTTNATAGMTGFDHDAHMDILDDDCALCHHVPDPATGHLMPADGDEAACAECHGETGTQTSLQEAAHSSCLGCHEGDGGPLTCSECHGSIENRLK